jgi:hypothetical protein
MRKNITAFILIAVGVSLEVYYYGTRFIADGTWAPLAYIIGAGLNLLLITAVRKKPLRYKLLSLALVVFSVVSTSAGQTFAMIQKSEREVKQITAPEIASLEKENEALEKEIEDLNGQITGTVTTLEDRYEWRNTLNKAEKQREEKRAKINENRERQAELRAGRRAGKDEGESVYTFYSRILRGKIGADMLKFILHTILSVFIALMAPVGILSVERKDENAIGKKTNELTDDEWVRLMWRGTRLDHPVYGIPNDELMRKYCEIAKKEWNLARHGERVKRADTLGLISLEKGKILVSQEEAEEKMGIKKAGKKS